MILILHCGPFLAETKSNTILKATRNRTSHATTTTLIAVRKDKPESMRKTKALDASQSDPTSITVHTTATTMPNPIPAMVFEVLLITTTSDCNSRYGNAYQIRFRRLDWGVLDFSVGSSRETIRHCRSLPEKLPASRIGRL